MSSLVAQTCCSETFGLMSALEGESDLMRGGLEGRVLMWWTAPAPGIEVP